MNFWQGFWQFTVYRFVEAGIGLALCLVVFVLIIVYRLIESKNT